MSEGGVGNREAGPGTRQDEQWSWLDWGGGGRDRSRTTALRGQQARVKEALLRPA